MKKVTVPGSVDEQGRLNIDRQLFANHLRQFSGKEVTVTVAKKVKHRSNNQNAYLWAVVYPHVLEGLIGVGYDIEPNDTETVHEWAKNEFIESRKIKQKDFDTFIELPGSTAGLSTEDFGRYIERIAQFAAEFLGVVIPPPTAEWAWPEKEYQ